VGARNRGGGTGRKEKHTASQESRYFEREKGTGFSGERNRQEKGEGGGVGHYWEKIKSGEGWDSPSNQGEGQLRLGEGGPERAVKEEQKEKKHRDND